MEAQAIKIYEDNGPVVWGVGYPAAELSQPSSLNYGVTNPVEAGAKSTEYGERRKAWKWQVGATDRSPEPTLFRFLVLFVAFVLAVTLCIVE